MQVALDGKGHVLETLGPLRAELSGESRGEVALKRFSKQRKVVWPLGRVKKDEAEEMARTNSFYILSMPYVAANKQISGCFFRINPRN